MKTAAGMLQYDMHLLYGTLFKLRINTSQEQDVRGTADYQSGTVNNIAGWYILLNLKNKKRF